MHQSSAQAKVFGAISEVPATPVYKSSRHSILIMNLNLLQVMSQGALLPMRHSTTLAQLGKKASPVRNLKITHIYKNNSHF